MLNKNNTSQKVMELFYKFPTRKFHLREISRLVKLSAPTVSSTVTVMVKDKLLIRKKTKVIDEIMADIDSENFKLKKRLSNIKNLYKSGLINYIKKSNISTIVLFGSYSRGEDIERSDIDIFIVGKPPKFNLEIYEKKLNRKINIHHTGLSMVSKEFKNNLINGIVLEGYLTLP